MTFLFRNYFCNLFIGKEKDIEIENMTDKQFDVLMNSIIQIVKDSETREEAVEKLQNLIKDKDN